MPRRRPVAHGGWFTTKYPVSLTVDPLPWAQVVTGDPRWER
ncbi:hypothetical protein I553_10454 [Mycobacterium xenopi 4042]|uniref:Uncharacterized protein n=1 Tax=Mycobacterium xenopi 4042 TaxID=1299334 RepID=X8E8K4_MYCXE|nr:hypothetical protein I553_10454 [Mycobacterium xenopi 4042]